MKHTPPHSIQSNNQHGVTYGSFEFTPILLVKETLKFRTHVGINLGGGNNKFQPLKVPEVKEISIKTLVEFKDSRSIDLLLIVILYGTYVKTYILTDNVDVVHISTFSVEQGSD
ncbi:hypothetical protein K502DRAFT_350711 [Neoconidiobolus thromboides FSU 785]|nr:hypothetical protein K502DRAFT_350711 [Neoconidiobolus thromboides FSU 785]